MTPELPLAWDRETLLAAYDELTERSERFREIAEVLSKDQWVELNQALDAGSSQEEAAGATQVPRLVVRALGHPRACMEKWDHDVQSVADCIDGKIDP